MKKYQTGLLFFAVFFEPTLEAAMPAILPEVFRGISLFAALVVLMLLLLPGRWVLAAVMTAAAWRDIVLLAPYASTMLGVGLGLAVSMLLARILTNRSLPTHLIIIFSVYASFVFGEAVASLVAERWGYGSDLENYFKFWPLFINFVLVMVIFFLWHRRQSSVTNYNFYKLS
ncbi:hypothetical protein A3H10_02620 [Candidatus Uhrbacteria bacterium RIFCSPLOWO2_12_FULL_46_10]|uniref:Rod shape-determining protein MreD n=1 Tax=Candidatus Uhrbacteria bacterium RIFCSPLOWO2_01_FULL_47_25 TaxID=1802402 RepID=A0A1F7UV29_9BACT|nr:MAG: hypothetical protein A2752_02380 [Candidatus Uhrbacteria bacterium RIFCSPHIGHO2_01_FULL_46_23]OGL68706.1 MAG: hypothetical protein A3D60_01985 [Candidatus Uhrbacteria bacterium RIFCSPHIGHO2_02_FULL_47_29]OGL82143.1 MAG: hypothetical protein A2936_01100 [Candidatus Uhrbacteria bacterium RIFCSPLOWO2_01_FULL_47_25]OGL85652.1 MAG: hypothetical protein A3I37_04225 [Candidatus Uhrbacteria bacterium RIFCSPLOWO2_02_FULL_46_19]OGL91402.1 MAG: hypothetical protein A3H10_02620 [Candidatus Uhrbacte